MRTAENCSTKHLFLCVGLLDVEGLIGRRVSIGWEAGEGSDGGGIW